jgi:hypothetical protein
MADLSMIVRMVIYKCRELENPVTETLAAYIAQTTLNNGTFCLQSSSSLLATSKPEEFFSCKPLN